MITSCFLPYPGLWFLFFLSSFFLSRLSFTSFPVVSFHTDSDVSSCPVVSCSIVACCSVLFPLLLPSSLLLPLLWFYYLISFWLLLCSFFPCLLKIPKTSGYSLLSSPVLHRLSCPLCHWPLWLAENPSPRRLHHVRLAGERPGTQKPHASLTPSHPAVLLCPSMHPARQQPNVRVHVGHRVAPHAAGLLQVRLALLLHQRSQRRRVGGVVMLSDGDLRVGVVT